MKNATLHIPSISCSGCVNTITRAISSMPVHSVLVNETSKTLSFDYEEENQLEEVKKRLETIGYKSE